MTLDERLQVLSAVPEFRGMPAQARSTLASAMREEFFASGETVVAKGEHADRVFVLCQGSLEVSQMENVKGVRRLERGALLGELAFFANDMRTATVRAVSDCTLLSLPYENFRAFLIAYPESALILTARIVRTLRDVESEMVASQRR